jgi:hypothetical protein
VRSVPQPVAARAKAAGSAADSGGRWRIAPESGKDADGACPGARVPRDTVEALRGVAAAGYRR